MERYTKIRTWVKGGTSSVDIAWDTTLNKPVVLKHINTLPPKTIETEVISSRRSHESAHGAIPCLDWFEHSQTPGQYTLVFECIHHIPSSDWLTNFSTNDIRRFIGQTLHILQKLHSSHIIHRDIKPSNILINQDTLNVHIIDFGCTVSPPGGKDYPICSAKNGTPSYRTPEQEYAIQTEIPWKPSPAIDIWAIGCMAMEWNTGIIPFFPRDSKLKMEAWIQYGILNEDGSINENGFQLKKVRRRCKTKSKHFENFVRQCLHPDPYKRANAKELIEHPWIQNGKYHACFLFETINQLYHRSVHQNDSS